MPLEFEISLPFEEIKMGGRTFIMRAATGDAHRAYRNAVAASLKYDADDRLISADNIADVEGLLITLCLVEVTDKGKRPVTLDELRALELPCWVQKELFELAKDLSRLNPPKKKDGEDEGDEAKNSPSATTDISA